MKKLITMILFSCLIFMSFPLSNANNTILLSDVFVDANVEKAVAKQLGVNSDDEIDADLLNTIYYLDIEGDVSSLNGLENLSHLSNLTFTNSNIVDLSLLNSMHSVRDLTIINNSVTPHNLGSLWLIRTLKIEGDIGIDTLYLPGMLYSLQLINTDVKNVEVSGFDFTSLVLLDMPNFNFSSLSDLRQFNYLVLDDTSIEALDYPMLNLETLVVQGEMSSLDPLLNHPNLENITLNNSNLNSKDEYEKLYNLQHLNRISLFANQLTDESHIVEIVSNHPSITHVELSNNYLTDFSSLDKMQQKDSVYFSAGGQKISSEDTINTDEYSREVEFIVPDSILNISDVTVSPSYQGTYDEQSNTVTWTNLYPQDTLSYTFLSLYYGDSFYVIEGNSRIDVSRSYSLTFDSNGGSSIDPLLNLPFGSVITKPDNPTKAGYEFDGWFRDTDLTYPYYFEYEFIYGDTTLYAKWIEKTYTLTFNSNDGSYIDPVTDILNESLVNAPIEPTRSGYHFAGWFQDSNLTLPWNFETDIITDDVTLYAKWIENTYTITFDSNGGSMIDPTLNITSGTKISAPNVPTRTGYQFDGWFKDQDLTLPWNFDNDVVTEDGTLYARWITDTPITPIDPEKPVNPSDPINPENPVEPTVSDDASQEEGTNPILPLTGQNNELVGAGLIIIFIGIAILVIPTLRKKLKP